MEKIVILNNKKCQFLTQDAKLFNELYNFLAFRLEGVEYTPQYKYNGWNGITHLMTKKGMFASGLLQTAIDKLTDCGSIPIIEDKREPVVAAPKLDIGQRLIDMKKVPREHQVRILETILCHRKGIVRSCTGSG